MESTQNEPQNNNMKANISLVQAILGTLSIIAVGVGFYANMVSRLDVMDYRLNKYEIELREYRISFEKKLDKIDTKLERILEQTPTPNK